MNNAFVIVAIIGILFGGFGATQLSKLNPFSSKNKVHYHKSESRTNQYYRDKVKGVEWQIEERHENKVPTQQKQTFGAKLGNFVDASWKLLIWFGIFSLVLAYFTGFKTWVFIRNLIHDRNRHRKGLRQSIAGIEKAKPKMNGELGILKDALRDKQDADTKKLIAELKNEE